MAKVKKNNTQSGMKKFKKHGEQRTNLKKVKLVQPKIPQLLWSDVDELRSDIVESLKMHRDALFSYTKQNNLSDKPNLRLSEIIIEATAKYEKVVKDILDIIKLTTTYNDQNIVIGTKVGVVDNKDIILYNKVIAGLTTVGMELQTIAGTISTEVLECYDDEGTVGMSNEIAEAIEDGDKTISKIITEGAL